MARKNEVQYVNFYTAGSAAYKFEPVTEQKPKATLPKPRRAKRIRIFVDPVVVLGMFMAMLMLVMTVTGIVRYNEIRRQEDQLQAYVALLQQKNEKLEADYHAGYDADEIYEIATAMGMIPASQAEHLRLPVTVMEPEPEPTGWENFCSFLAGLFA